MSFQSRQLLWLGSAEVLSRGAAFVIFLLAAHWLSKKDLADYLVVFALANICWSAAQLGTGMHGIREIARAKTLQARQQVSSEMLQLRLLITPVAAIVAFVVVIYLLGLSLSLALLTGVFILARAPQVDWLLRALAEYSALAVVMTCSAIASIFFAVIIMFLLPASAVAMLSHLVSIVLILLGSWYCLLRQWGRGWFRWFSKASRIYRHLGGSTAIGLAGMLALTTQSLPLFYLNYLNQVEATSTFGSAMRFLQLALGAITVLSFMHYPAIVRSLHTPADDIELSFGRYVSDLTVLSSAFVALVLTVAPSVELLVLGESSSGRLFLGLISLAPLYFIRSAISDIVIAKGHVKLLLASFILGFMCSLLFCLLFLAHAESPFRTGVVAVIIGEATTFALLAIWIFVSENPDWITRRTQRIFASVGLYLAVASLLFLAEESTISILMLRVILIPLILAVAAIAVKNSTVVEAVRNIGG